MNWNNFTNMMPDANRINQLANMAQTVGQFATSAQRFIGTTIAETNETAIGRAKTELQFIEPVIGGPSNQNLFDGFTREFLKCLMFAGGVGNATAARALLEERRADRDGCTPLLCAVKRNDLDGALQLLAYGADPHRADANGDTPLHHAVMASSVQIVKLLLCFGANLNVPNNAGQTANSLKIKNRQLADEIISRARMWMQHGVCSAGDIQDNCSSKVDSKRDVAIARVAREQQHLALLYQQHRTTSLSAGGGGDDRMSSNALRLLSLDGGGIRGLVLIQMLMEIERLMDGGTKTKQQKEKANFVQRHFDWIAGTSTGAILALALADGTPLLDCLRLYLRLKDDVFGPQAKASRFGGYKPECIERFLQEHFGEQRKMADLRCGKMKVFVTATKAEQIPIELVLFRNYNSPFAASDKHAPEKVRIWQAARYSSAAPTYFQSMDGLMDGGLIANNPSNELLREVYLHNEAAQLNITNERQKEIAFMLSLGTGKTPPVGVDSIDLVIEPTFSTILQSLKTLNNLKSILVEQLATSDGQVVESAQMLCHLQKVPYFRLTPQLRVDIPLDTVDNDTLVDMLWDAKVYVREQCAEDVQALIEIMQDYEGLT